MYHNSRVVGLNGDYGEIMTLSSGIKRNQCFRVFFALVIGLLLSTNAAYAVEVDDISVNIGDGIGYLPGLLTALMYLLGLVFSVTGVIKLRDHVENPAQTPPKAFVPKFLAGGALFALPVIFNAMFSTIGTGVGVEATGALQNGAGIRGILSNIAGGIETLPQLLGAISYLLGLVFMAAGILKIKDHIENPEQTAIKESVIRFGVGGTLFTLPTIYSAMQTLITGGGSFNSGRATDIKGNDLSEIMSSIAVDFVQIQYFVLYVLGYLLALLLGVSALLKLKEHVENPAQVPLKTPLVRFLIGGLLFAMPAAFKAIEVLINGGSRADFDPTKGVNLINGLSKIAGALGTITPDLNGMMASIEKSLSGTEGFIVAIAYLLGVFIVFAGLLKLKEHVENPDQNPLKEVVVRFIVGGALFALPTVFQTMHSLISGGGGIGLMANISQATTIAGWMTSPYAEGNIVKSFINSSALGTVGAALRGTMLKTLYAPAFLNALAYVFGFILAIWGILKTRDHVQNPSQVSIWEGASRLIAGGAFFALPVTVEAIRSSIAPTSSSALGILGTLTGSQYAGKIGKCDGGTSIGGAVGAIGNALGIGGNGNNGNESAAPGLDNMIGCMMSDILGPMHGMLSFFGYVAGTIFIMIGISRLTKSAQDGARGPGGIGTFMTFIAGGALISFNDLMRTFSFTMFSDIKTKTYATLSYTKGFGGAEDSALVVISAILKFMIIIGLISFIRGIFIVRKVAEGDSQSSMMAAITHLVAGAIAVNLGAFLELVQGTLGISKYGISFAASDGSIGGMLGF